MFRTRLIMSLIVIAFIMVACDTEGVPQVTPTIAPSPTATQESDIPTEIAFVIPPSTETPEITPSETLNPSETFTTTPSNTPTITSTATNTPSNTPTITPNPSQTFTLTPSSTPTNTSTPTTTNTATTTSTPTDTVTPTQTNTATNTLTPSPTNTPNPSITPTPTPTLTATVTPSATSTLTNTPIPSPTPLPTIGATSTPTPTFTPSNTATPTNSLTPRPTNTSTQTNTPLPPPSPDLTDIANQLTQTADAFAQTLTAVAPTPTLTETWTAVPRPSVTNTVGVAPTLNVTPTFITAEPTGTLPPDDLGIITPIPGTETVEEFGPTSTPSPASTVAISVPIPPTISAQEIGGVQVPSQPVVRPFAITTSGGFGGGSINSLLSDTNLFVQNPVNAGQFVLTNGAGTLFTSNNGNLSRPNSSPFSEFEAQSRAENNAFVSYAQWSPNGQWVAFIIDGDRYGANPTDNDGVHILNPSTGASFDILRDCPYEGHPGCQTGGARQFLHQTIGLQWSPNSTQVVVTIDIIGRGRAQYVIGTNQDPNQQPQTTLYYDYASWSRDGSRLIVSGNSGQGVIIGTVNPDGGGLQVILNGSAIGLWVQDAIQSSNGNIYALGRPGGANGAMAIYDTNGNQLTGFIGGARPTRVAWSPDGTAVLVTTADGRQYVANINGAITDITDQAGNNAVNWIYSPLPPVSEGSPGVPQVDDGTVPSGVVEGSQYQPGQQLRVLVASLNVRDAPNRSANAVGSLFIGEYVAILAGPAPNGGDVWWQVQTASGTVGWIAGEINGFASIGF